MKYVLIIALIAVLVRIDVFLGVFDRATAYLRREKPPVLVAQETKAPSELVLVSEDKFLKQNPRSRFINMIETFGRTPDETIHQKALEEFKSSPTMFGKGLDKQLEGAIFSWRDLVIQDTAALPGFLIDLMRILQGENKAMVVRFYSLLLDQNLKQFLESYGKSGDVNCIIATVIADPLPDEEKRNVLFDREQLLNAFVNQEKTDPTQKKIADTCLLKLRNYLAALPPLPTTPATEPEEPAPVQPAPAPEESKP